MSDEFPNFEGQNKNNNLDPEQTKLRIDEVRRELMDLERELLLQRRYLYKHVDDPEVLHKIALAEERQKKLLSELGQLKNAE